MLQDEPCQQEEFSANAEEVPFCGIPSANLKSEPPEPLSSNASGALTNIQYTFNQQTNNVAAGEEEDFDQEPPSQMTHEEERETLTSVQQLGVKLNPTVRSIIQ